MTDVTTENELSAQATATNAGAENGGKPTLNQKKRNLYEERSLFLGHICLKLGLTPNIITGISFLISIASGVFFWKQMMLWGVGFMFLSAFTDMLDGSTARAGNMGTTFGGFLDHVSDRYGEFFILAGVTLSGAVHPGWALSALFSMLIASYTRAAAESLCKIENCAVGIMGRLEKFILIMTGAVLEHFYPTQRWLEIALIIVSVASLITAVQRLVYTKRVLDKREKA
jgi:phosphatidylglycerophosphate synthase